MNNCNHGQNLSPTPGRAEGWFFCMSIKKKEWNIGCSNLKNIKKIISLHEAKKKAKFGHQRERESYIFIIWLCMCVTWLKLAERGGCSC
jgi:hypothetical protein